MKRLYSGKLILPYAVLVFLFSAAFNHIERFYIQPECLKATYRDFPIDSHAFNKHQLSTGAYVKNEGLSCYDVSGYFRTFFPLDMVFPIVYSLLLLSLASLSGDGPFKKVLIYSIFIGAIFDYLEDFSFAIFLKTHADSFASVTAVFTNLKTLLLIVNGLACLFILGRWIINNLGRGRSVS